MKSLIMGQAEHLRPHQHAIGASITCQDGEYRVSCCGQTAETLVGLGLKPCTSPVAVAATPAVTFDSTSGVL